jgi:hypothetical protein
VAGPQEPAGAHPLISAVRAGDAARVGELLAAGADSAARDEDDWSALDWAAGRGDAAIIGILLDQGADPSATGREQRRPHEIALAAGHLEPARRLREAADRADPEHPADHAWRPYCRAYPLAEMQRYPGWPATAVPAAGDVDADEAAGDPGAEVVFLHDDMTVTAAIWPGEDVLFADITPEWVEFCATELRFAVPDELDLAPAGAPPEHPGPLTQE